MFSVYDHFSDYASVLNQFLCWTDKIMWSVSSFVRTGTKRVFIAMSAKWFSHLITLSATRRGHIALCKCYSTQNKKWIYFVKIWVCFLKQFNVLTCQDNKLDLTCTFSPLHHFIYHAFQAQSQKQYVHECLWDSHQHQRKEAEQGDQWGMRWHHCAAHIQFMKLWPFPVSVSIVDRWHKPSCNATTKIFDRIIHDKVHFIQKRISGPRDYKKKRILTFFSGFWL